MIHLVTVKRQGRLFQQQQNYFGIGQSAMFLYKTVLSRPIKDVESLLLFFYWIFKHAFQLSILSSLAVVEGLLARGKFSKISGPLLNALFHLNTFYIDLYYTL